MTSEEFRAIRQALGLNQTELADRLGMTQPMVSRIERGERQPTVQQGAAIMLLAELMKKENGQGKNPNPCP
jgi:transcriptional regulator with XRE-family HTH domain